ncbi:GNAT family N-acetyltransferase [Actinomadura sp. HBU206391]|uniref:GNAT family N-acetyltransferase n=1 Tax=Actinomadura sp. HBU206391 TaxID=2731692 RepID=UPI00164FF7A2|nr:GNAT family N-acetyltransferase [Actinomadura sp. HBU206391]MBC6456386.1 GNAT family N-acetyltransferase [Actinomadura sp. HBU206391]
MTSKNVPDMRQIHHPHEIDAELTRELVDCWVKVTNAGGAAGFPFPPVTVEDVAPVAEQLITGLHPQRSRLVVALVDGVLAGWLNIRRDPHPLVAHWGTVYHVQSHTAFRGRGIGSALMNHTRQVARDAMGLEQLHLAARAGVGLEDFYGGLGWKEIGRWPSALRLAPGDDLDEILMVLTPL